jgi:RNA polymerase subunit RPABC4/transcription elongation factor Spt4
MHQSIWAELTSRTDQECPSKSDEDLSIKWHDYISKCDKESTSRTDNTKLSRWKDNIRRLTGMH